MVQIFVQTFFVYIRFPLSTYLGTVANCGSHRMAFKNNSWRHKKSNMLFGFISSKLISLNSEVLNLCIKTKNGLFLTSRLFLNCIFFLSQHDRSSLDRTKNDVTTNNNLTKKHAGKHDKSFLSCFLWLKHVQRVFWVSWSQTLCS